MIIDLKGYKIEVNNIPPQSNETCKFLLGDYDLFWIDTFATHSEVLNSEAYPSSTNPSIWGYYYPTDGDIESYSEESEDRMIPLLESYFPNALEVNWNYEKRIPINQVPQEEKRIDNSSSPLTQDFFSAVQNKMHEPATKLLDEHVSQDPYHQEIYDNMKEFSGPFDEHIETSIPDFRNNSLMVIESLLNLGGGTFLDIAGSTGSFGKTLTSMSGGAWQTVNLDPNPEMVNFFNENPIEGASVLPEAFGGSFEQNGTTIPHHDPGQNKYDVVHESMGFQFMSSERDSQIAEAKQLLNPGGLFITQEKLHTANEEENERLKDENFKSYYYNTKQLEQKNKEVGFQGQGVITDNLMWDVDFEESLQNSFQYVQKFWESGNFMGYACSDDQRMLEAFIGGMGMTTTSSRKVVSGIHWRRVTNGYDDSYYESPDGMFTITRRRNEDKKGRKYLWFLNTNDPAFFGRNLIKVDDSFRSLLRYANALINEFYEGGERTASVDTSELSTYVHNEYEVSEDIVITDSRPDYDHKFICYKGDFYYWKYSLSSSELTHSDVILCLMDMYGEHIDLFSLLSQPNFFVGYWIEGEIVVIVEDELSSESESMLKGSYPEAIRYQLGGVGLRKFDKTARLNLKIPDMDAMMMEDEFRYLEIPDGFFTAWPNPGKFNKFVAYNGETYWWEGERNDFDIHHPEVVDAIESFYENDDKGFDPWGIVLGWWNDTGQDRYDMPAGYLGAMDDSGEIEVPADIAQQVSQNGSVVTASANKRGVMVALVPPQEVIDALHFEGGEDKDDFHITLAYPGNPEDFDISGEELVEIIRRWADEHVDNLRGRVSGFGTFCNDDNHVLYASMDIPHVDDLRHDLADLLEPLLDVDLDETHGFTPHMTLAYWPEEIKELPDMPDLPEDFPLEVVVAYDGEWTKIAKMVDEEGSYAARKIKKAGVTFNEDYMITYSNDPLQTKGSNLWINPEGQVFTWNDEGFNTFTHHGQALIAMNHNGDSFYDLDDFERESWMDCGLKSRGKAVEEGWVLGVTGEDTANQLILISQKTPNVVQTDAIKQIMDQVEFNDFFFDLSDIQVYTKDKNEALAEIDSRMASMASVSSPNAPKSFWRGSIPSEKERVLEGVTARLDDKLSILDFYKFADKEDREEKAQKIFDQGGVEFVSATPDPEQGRILWEFNVKSTSGNTYPIYGETDLKNPTEWIDWFDVACSCFPAGTPVTMSDGTQKPIEEIEKGDRVLTKEGNIKSVVKTMKRPYRSQLSRIKKKGFGEIISSTPNHRFWVKSKGGEVDWKQAFDIEPGDFVSSVIPKKYSQGVTFDMADYCNIPDIFEDYIQPMSTVREDFRGEVKAKGVATRVAREYIKKRGNPVWRFIELDEQIAYVGGLYLGDGNARVRSNGSEVTWTFGANEIELARIVSFVVEDRFGLVGNIYQKDNKTIVTCASEPLANFFISEFGGPRDKKISTSVMNSHPEILLKIAEGHYDSDNNTSSNRSLISQLQQIYLLNNITFAISMKSSESQISPLLRKYADERGQISKATKGYKIYGKWYREDNRRSDRRHLPVQINGKVSKQRMNSKTRFIEYGHQWDIVESNSLVNYEGSVYNFEVEDDHSYQVFGTNVANCDWGRWNYDRAPDYKHLEREHCSHSIAANTWLQQNGQREADRSKREQETGMQELQFETPTTGPRKSRPQEQFVREKAQEQGTTQKQVLDQMKERGQNPEQKTTPQTQQAPSSEQPQQPNMFGDEDKSTPENQPPTEQPEEPQEPPAPPEPVIEPPKYEEQILRPRTTLDQEDETEEEDERDIQNR